MFLIWGLYYYIMHKRNCLICECKRGQDKKYVALIVPTGYRYNMSSTVRKYTNSRMVSVSPLEYVLEKTKMEYGSINPIGLPSEWSIFIDPKVLEADRIICGSGLQKSKISLPSEFLLKLENSEVLENLEKK
jgi:prolyl-tRNA editing enzyme YbaK/EbsC (Cys-tRNA(Pro) deacylase)